MINGNTDGIITLADRLNPLLTECAISSEKTSETIRVISIADAVKILLSLLLDFLAFSKLEDITVIFNFFLHIVLVTDMKQGDV